VPARFGSSAESGCVGSGPEQNFPGRRGVAEGNSEADRGIPRYDRDYLLSPAKRNQVVELWEVEKFGRDSFGDPDAVALYGMRPAEWYAKGVRILARTLLEAVRDPLGDLIGADVARIAGTAPPGTRFGVVDCFAGSCNGLASILRHLPGAQGIGFEFEPAIFDMSSRNIASLDAPIQLFNGDFRALLGAHRVPSGQHVVAFLAPPWADALSREVGLDLARTKPPIREIIEGFETVYANSPILYVVEVHERLVPEPLAALRGGFEWSELSIYDLAGPTGRHGVLLGTRRWRG
jgi:hypothetical protein